jgi:hypothetical protein
LVRQGADSAQNQWFCTCSAHRRGKTFCAESDTSVVSAQNKHRKLSQSQCRGSIESVQNLNTHFRDAGDTPLVSAVLCDTAAAVTVLLASGSDAKVVSATGVVASLLFAAKSAAVVKLLLDAGLKINQHDSQGMSVLHALVLYSLPPAKAVPLLCLAIKAGADLAATWTPRGRAPETAAETAARKGNALAVQLLARAARDVK